MQGIFNQQCALWDESLTGICCWLVSDVYTILSSQDTGYIKEAKASKHPGRLDHPRGPCLTFCCRMSTSSRQPKDPNTNKTKLASMLGNCHLECTPCKRNADIHARHGGPTDHHEAKAECDLSREVTAIHSGGIEVLHVPRAGSKSGSASQKAAHIKAKWQAEIRAYTAHVYLQDGVVDMSEDLGYDNCRRHLIGTTACWSTGSAFYRS